MPSSRLVKRELKLLLRNIYESILYYPNRNRKFPDSITRVVFVCKGNICRSAFAEYMMKTLNIGTLLSVASCGLNVDSELPSPYEAIKTAKCFGLDMDSHLSKGLKCFDQEFVDLILTMEFWQYRKMVELFPQKKGNIKLLREYAPFPENLLCNIPDPYGHSEIIFKKCFGQIKRCVMNIPLQ